MNAKTQKALQSPDRLSSYFWREAGPLALVTASGIGYNVGMLAGPYFEGRLAQCLFEILQGTALPAAMLRLAAAYLVSILLVQGMRCVKRFYVRRFANDTARRMRAVLYNRLVHSTAAALSGESAGTLMTKAVADVDACTEGMRKVTTEIFDTGVVLAAYLGMLLYYDARLTLVCCACVPAAYGLAHLLRTTVVRCTAAAKVSAGRLNDATLDRVGHALTYRIFGGEAQRGAAYEQSLDDYEKKAVAASLWENTMQPLYNILSMTGAVFILWLGAKNVRGTGWAAWDIAAFTTFLACFTKLAAKSSHAAKLFNAVQKAQVSWRRIRPLLGEERTLDTKTGLDLDAPRTLSVEGLRFAYPGGETLFEDVSFTVQPGQILGVTGPVACGKSTLGKVFLCEAPYGGSVKLGGAELSSLTEYERSRLIGYMGHEPELLSDSLEENIRLGESAPVDEVLRAVQLEEEVAQMPQGVKTPLGGGGVRLSGGQQARAALARTLYRPHALLVLDDPFSAVDKKTEREILDALRERAKNSVVLLISHRLDCFASLDGVLWLENGHATATTHAALAAQNPSYAAFCRAQTQGGKDLDET